MGSALLAIGNGVPRRAILAAVLVALAALGAGAALRTRGVSDLRLHRGAEVAADGSGDEGHAGTTSRALKYTPAMPYC